MRYRGIGLWLAAATLGGCSSQQGVYDIGIDEAYARLQASELDELRMAQQCGILIHIQPQGQPTQSVTWHVSSSGTEVVNFTANLSAVGDNRTKVEIAVQEEPIGGEAYDGTQSYPRPAFNQPLRPAIQEQIAALLEGRPYDASHVEHGHDRLCNVQRAGLESGRPFTLNDPTSFPVRSTAREQ